ncbi:hypothetical protein WS50_12790 [Burkholderia territorii]|nr:hypothetical protein WS47_30585 [Burkholderia territorii]KUZ17652.1 hypothetical protein WS50_12790 [Burkholderia territorii]
MLVFGAELEVMVVFVFAVLCQMGNVIAPAIAASARYHLSQLVRVGRQDVEQVIRDRFGFDSMTCCLERVQFF